MRTFARSMGAVAFVVGIAFLYLCLGTRLRVRVLSETVVPASAYPEVFSQAVEKLGSGEWADAAFGALDGEDIAEYSFVEIRVAAQSFGLLPCEWITVGVTPLAGDIVLAQGDMADVEPFGAAETTALVLARADSAAAGHGVWIEYYAYGAHTFVDAARAD